MKLTMRELCMSGATGSRRHSKTIRGLGAGVAIGSLIALVGLSAPGAMADTVPPAGTPATASADVLPTWQVNGVVWDTVTIGNTVYATGSFSRARPPGTKAGDPSQVVRRNLLAFDIRTGVVTSFRHDLNAQGRRLAASPDGKTLYVGGDFTRVDTTKPRYRLAAFDLTTGTTKSGFKPRVNGVVRGITATSAKVFIGGDFTAVSGKARTRLASVRATTGAPYAWAPKADRGVYALAMAPGNTRVIVGGRFQKLNGAKKVGVGALNATSGRAVTWTSRPIPTRKDSTHYSYVTDLVVSGGVVYGTADGESLHWFDGRFAAKASNGNLVWLDNCYGATYSAFVRGTVFYSVGHAHDCRSIKAFPETKPRTHHRALAETTYATGRDSTPPGANSNYSKQPVPSLLHWFPTINAGTYTGQNQGAWAITGNASYIALAGEFTKVNGKAQQGLTRFGSKAVAPNKTGPVSSTGLVPKVSSTQRGVVHLAYKRTWDYDNVLLTYQISRDEAPIHSARYKSNFWYLKGLSYDDKGLVPGSTHTYKITVKDPFGNTRYSGRSRTITVHS
jgi:hypothetical protein